jgi:isoleucyl-tRNA synthetase
MLAAGSPWSARRVGHDAISDVVRKTLLTYWNTVSFFTLYANAADFTLPSETPELTTLDRWITSELATLIAGVDSAYANYDSQDAGRLIAKFIDDLSNWYVRRSRRRFWDGDAAALTTLYRCLKELTLLMAPMVPFITEHVWQELVRVAEPSAPLSVHLADFPLSRAQEIDQLLSDSVQLSRRLVELGRSARAESKIKIRQPLGRALVAANGWASMDAEIRSHVAEELNVLSLDDISVAGADLVSVSIKANFKSIGARYGGDVQPIAQAIATADATALVHTVRSTASASLTYGENKTAEISLEDLVITETPKVGWSVASHSGESLALDLSLTPALIEAGLVREVIRAIQEERKQAGFEISDRIIVTWSAPADIAEAVNKNEVIIAGEVLALGFTFIADQSDSTSQAREVPLWLELKRA